VECSEGGRHHNCHLDTTQPCEAVLPPGSASIPATGPREGHQQLLINGECTDHSDTSASKSTNGNVLQRISTCWRSCYHAYEAGLISV
jgi:hypothetical protein